MIAVVAHADLPCGLVALGEKCPSLDLIFLWIDAKTPLLHALRSVDDHVLIKKKPADQRVDRVADDCLLHPRKGPDYTYIYTNLLKTYTLLLQKKNYTFHAALD